MIAPRVAPWVFTLCAPLLLSLARGRHAHRAVRLQDGVRRVFNLVFFTEFYRTLGRVVYALGTLHLVRVSVLLALFVVGLVAVAAGGALLGGELPRGGFLAHRVRMRFHHPLVAWLVHEHCGAVF